LNPLSPATQTQSLVPLICYDNLEDGEMKQAVLATRKSKSRKIAEQQYPKERSSQLMRTGVTLEINTLFIHLAAI